MAKNNNTRFFYVLYSDKTWVFFQSEHAQGLIYVISKDKNDRKLIYTQLTYVFYVMVLSLATAPAGVYSSQLQLLPSRVDYLLIIILCSYYQHVNSICIGN